MGFLSNLFGIDDAKAAATNAANQNRTVANRAYAAAQDLQNPFYTQGVTANNFYGNALGLNGTGAQQDFYNNYVQGPDVAFRMQRGIDAIDNSSAARTGGVNSGGLLKRLNEFGQGVATQDLTNYLQRLAGQSAQGQTAANTLTGSAYNTAGLVSNANTAEGNAIANASLAGGSILSNLIGGALNLGGNLYGAGAWNPFGRGGSMTVNDPWNGIR